jgi:hypothetical protein
VIRAYAGHTPADLLVQYTLAAVDKLRQLAVGEEKKNDREKRLKFNSF